VRELHVVAVSEDGRHVVLAARRGSSKGAFKVALDATLAAAVRGDLPRPGDEQVPDVSPKEIQARLRAGEPVEKIARSAGVPLSRVERYAGPVQGEMARVIAATRDGYVTRGRLGRSAVDLGTAVDAALAHAGADEESVDWSTFRQEDGSWLVTLRWVARKRTRSASWAYDPAQRLVTPSDPASAALAHQADPLKPAKAPAAKKAPAKKPAAAAKKAPAKKAAAQRTPATKKAPVQKAPIKKAPTKVVAKKLPARPQRALRVVPDPEPGPARKAPKTAPKGKARASVPAWADVLLGTAPGGDR
jgi:hypothetical protein